LSAALRVEVTRERGEAEGLVGQVEALMREHNVYRGRVVAFGGDPKSDGAAAVPARPASLARSNLGAHSTSVECESSGGDCVGLPRNDAGEAVGPWGWVSE
jgi:hypothetical protein